MKFSTTRLKPVVLTLLLTSAAGILLLLAALTAILNTDNGTRLALSFGMSRINELPGHSLSYRASSGTLVSGLNLENLVYSNDAFAFSAHSAQIRWLPYSLLSGNLVIRQIILQDAQLQLQPDTDEPVITEQPRFQGIRPLPVTVNIGEFSLHDFNIQQGQQTTDLDELTFSASVENRTLQLQSLTLENELLALQGVLQLELIDDFPITAEIDWQYDGTLVAGYNQFRGQMALGGNLETLSVQHQLLSPEAISSSGTITSGLFNSVLAIDLVHTAIALPVPAESDYDLAFNDVTLNTVGSIENLRLSLNTQVSSNLIPSAAFSASGTYTDTGLEVTELELVTDSGGITGDGTITFAAGTTGLFSYQLQESNPLAYWPTDLPMEIYNLASNGELFFSYTAGLLNTSWRPDAVTGEIDTYPFLLEGGIDVSGNDLVFHEMLLSTSDNQLILDGELTDALNLTWSLNAPRLDQLIPGVMGRLQAQGQLTGTIETPQLQAAATLESASYQGVSLSNLELIFSGQETEVNGTLTLAGLNLESDSLPLALDTVVLELSGSGSNHDLALNVESSLGQLSLEVNGNLLDLSSRQWQGQVRRASVDSPIGYWQTEEASALNLSESVFEFSESCWLQNAARICFNLSGQIEIPGSSIQGAGSIANYSLDFLNHPSRRVTEPPLALASLPHLPGNARFFGNASGKFTFAMDSIGGRELDLVLTPEGVEIVLFEEVADSELSTPAENPVQAYSLVPGATIVAQLQRDVWNFRTNAGISGGVISDLMPFIGTVESSLQVDAQQNLEGRFSTEIGNIGWLRAFTPDFGNLDGRLLGDIDIGGNLDNPQLMVDMNLEDGRFSILPLGIEVSEVNGNLNSENNVLMTISASATSGAGRLQLTGQISEPLNPELQIQADLSGENFQLVSLPETDLVVSPQLAVKVSSESIDVNGTLHLPSLTVNLAELPESAVDISRDAIVVGYPPDQPQLAYSIASDQATIMQRPVSANVIVDLGDQVHFNGFGLSTRVSGNLNVQQQLNGNNLTYGELEIVDGNYQLYGQSLQIRQGKLLFFGAYDNPALDIRAAREIEDATVGVLMNGTLKNINSQLFSTPTLADSDIIAMLVTGRPFSELGQQDSGAMVGAIANLGLSRSQGLTNQVRQQLGLDALAITNTGSINNSILTIGKFLTPDLFIRYGIGLFDHQSKLALDYTLTERITLQAETGEYQSVDLLYKVER